MEIYDFAKEFSKNPGLRKESMTPGISGEKFRDEVLEKYFKANKPIYIDVNGVESSLGSSFLSEAFGNIAVKYGKDKFLEIVHFVDGEKNQITKEMMINRVEEAIKKMSE
ncbi:STAS-like domain-containing protein [Campylobacter hominis]|uniref:DUF4325 domain-containing protein n=1 Tax=Campylobacter hominis (strain ATCC BAA-381 / DSM 21671 / CCUG 45161 / LMG 19568 / NCTC 13146 / CH001A) TaxID=360107 RepID=A7I365_CAMHC|nr:STAS-like domain-containing protein [Campylobacter hominis]ABS50916.1 conserved hypothetical protein [Campylobacter hominis ATCC BAA-381]UAK85818.1 STAS-like domain-containing protein [Campylobacter hominis]SUW85462.1 Uncharacterised protein [Campylobacter hominis]